MVEYLTLDGKYRCVNIPENSFMNGYHKLLNGDVIKKTGYKWYQSCLENKSGPVEDQFYILDTKGQLICDTILMSEDEFKNGKATFTKDNKNITIVKSGTWWYESALLQKDTIKGHSFDSICIDELSKLNVDAWTKRINDSLIEACNTNLFTGEKMAAVTSSIQYNPPVQDCGWYSDLQKTNPYQSIKVGDKTMMRKVKLIVIDHDEKLDLLNKIVYESSDYFWTDKSNETVFFEADLAGVIKKHNEYRKGKNLPEKQWSDLSRTVHVQVSV